MRDQPIERSPNPNAPIGGASKVEGTSGAKIAAPQRRERRGWRLVVGLTGLLGVAWAVAIASRYPNLLPG